MARPKSNLDKKIASIEISLRGGPLDKKIMDVAYPNWEYYVLDMGRSLYVKVSSTEYMYSQDWSITKQKETLI
jgi:hypothetical protein